MKFKLIISLILLILGFNILVLGEDIYKARGINLIESTNNGVIIKFQPELWIKDTLKIQGQEYIKLDFFSASFEGEPGAPLIPVLPISVGVPLNSNISYTIIESQFMETSGKLIPHPEVINKNKIDHYRYTENDSIYSSNEIYPNQLVEISNPGFFRDQRLITIKLKPVQFIPASNKIRLYQNIVVKIDFTGPIKKNEPQKLSPVENSLYKDIIINYDKAKYWQQQRVRSMKKYHSNFSNDRWLKLFIEDEGIYKISGSYLADFGIDINSIAPQTLKIYNNGGRMLNRNVDETRPDSLIENAIYVNDGGDGLFDNSDYILFYGKAVDNWAYHSGLGRYEHYINHYEDFDIYWLTWGGVSEGKRMQTINSSQDVSITPEFYFISPFYFEQEINNVYDSGLEWFGRFFTDEDEYTFSVNLPDAIPDETFFKFRFIGWTTGKHSFTIYVNGNSMDTFSSQGKGPFKNQKTNSGFIIPGYNDIKIKYDSSYESGQAYLDWFEIHYQQEFIASDNFLLFYTTPASSSKKYTITGFNNDDIKTFDVTNYYDTKLVQNTTISNNQLTFIDDSNLQTSKKIIVLTSSAYKTPERIEEAEFRDLRNPANGADYLIIVYDDFYDAIQPLAQHRESHDEFETMVVKISEVYNEFSWGLFDPTAIRDFIKYAYFNWQPKPGYVLLCGDGDFDYKNVINNLDKNWIPTYQTDEVYSQNLNYSTDDWFVFVSGGNKDTYPDLAIGRLPVQSAEETKIMVDKIKAYETAELLNETENYIIDDWRNTITVVGDDELIEGGTGNETEHTNDSERIIEYYIPNKFNKKKIYLSEYPAVENISYLSALLKPAAMEAIIKQINQGTLIINYLGHGNPTTWSHEYVLYAPRDFDKIINGSKLALWVAATCNFGQFDDPSTQSLAEDLLVAEGRGAIAVLASTREVYADRNAALTRSFYTRLFQNQQTTERQGLALLKAKIDNFNGVNDQKYVLLGDPAMRLATPRYQAVINSVKPDTIKALSQITVTGNIKKDNVIWDDFKGKILLKAFDSKKNRRYVTERGTVMNYILSGNTIFKGIDTVHDGKFEISFIVPKDITYGGHLGRVSIYFSNNEMNGNGYKDSLLVGGTSEIFDNEGPVIEISFKDQSLFNEAFTDEKPVLKIDISDTLSGINIVGDIGHNITMIVDDDEENKVILTDLFQYNEGSYTRGTMLYDFSNYTPSETNQDGSSVQYSGLQEGHHQIEIKAWDNTNNSSIELAEFEVVSGSDLELKNVLNYPNPFSKNTTFSFWANQDCNVRLKIYTIAGKLLKTFDEFSLDTNEFAQINWNGRDAEGDILANGVYFYKVIAKANINGKSKTKEVIQKLVIMR